jgi:hypothetical protein
MTMSEEVKLTAETAARDPLALARTYQHGLRAGLWASLRDAVKVFRESRIPVSYAILHCAVKVSVLPVSVLRLFNDIPLTNAGAATLLKLTARDGLEALSERSERINPGQYQSCQTLLDALMGQEPLRSGARLRGGSNAPRTVHPLMLASEYAEGVAAGKWLTRQDAALALGYTLSEVTQAVQISAVPSEVLALFREGDITLWVGRKLVSLCNSRGASVLIGLAAGVAVGSRPLSTKAAFDILSVASPGTRASMDAAEQQRIEFPLGLAKEYERGKLQGRWSTRTDADSVLGLAKDTVGVALRISKLPRTVLEVFEPEEIIFFLGRKLLSIQKAVGHRIFLENAKAASATRPRPTREQIFAILAGDRHRPSRHSGHVQPVTVALRVRVSGAETYIRVTSPQIMLLGKHTEAIREWCELLLAKETGGMDPDRNKP